MHPPTPDDKSPAACEKNPKARLNPNRARDHLANERTYLAWIRTAVTLFSFGVLIVRLRYLMPVGERQSHGWELGLLFSLVGLLMVGLAHAQYFSVARSIERDTYEPTTRWVSVCTGAVLLLGAAVLYFLMSSPSALPAPSAGAHLWTGRWAISVG